MTGRFVFYQTCFDALVARWGLLGHLPRSRTEEPHVQNRPQLQGTFVLQLNEVVNIAAPARDRCDSTLFCACLLLHRMDVQMLSLLRYKPDSGRRCLKLHLTDGT